MPVWPIVVYSVLAFIVVAGMILVSYVLGERRRDIDIQASYESGIVSSSSGKPRCSVKFYLVAMLFVVFDVESIFIFAWAVAFPDLGLMAYVDMCVFVSVMLVALAYAWRSGALDWGAGRKTSAAPGRQ